MSLLKSTSVASLVEAGMATPTESSPPRRIQVLEKRLAERDEECRIAAEAGLLLLHEVEQVNLYY